MIPVSHHPCPYWTHRAQVTWQGWWPSATSPGCHSVAGRGTQREQGPPWERTGSPPQRGQGPPHPERTAALLTCRLLLVLWAPHLCTRKSHFEKQSKKLQSSSPVQFCSRISLILGSKKAMSTSIATTCNWNSTRLSRGPPRPQHRGSPAVSPHPVPLCRCKCHRLQGSQKSTSREEGPGCAGDIQATGIDGMARL